MARSGRSNDPREAGWAGVNRELKRMDPRLATLVTTNLIIDQRDLQRLERRGRYALRNAADISGRFAMEPVNDLARRISTWGMRKQRKNYVRQANRKSRGAQFYLRETVDKKGRVITKEKTQQRHRDRGTNIARKMGKGFQRITNYRTGIKKKASYTAGATIGAYGEANVFAAIRKKASYWNFVANFAEHGMEGVTPANSKFGSRGKPFKWKGNQFMSRALERRVDRVAGRWAHAIARSIEDSRRPSLGELRSTYR